MSVEHRANTADDRRQRPRRGALRALVVTFGAAAALSCSDSSSPARVASVTIEPASASLLVGTSTQFSASLFDEGGNRIGGRRVTWASDNPAVVSITQAGLATAVTQGQTTIRVSSGGKSATATVTTSAPGFDFDIVDVQFTQAIQAADGSIPMVLGGNAAAVNVLLASTVTEPVTMQLVLRLTSATGALLRADTATINGVLNASPSHLSPSAQFLLPASAIVPGMRWQVVRDPRKVLPDANAANDVFPRGAPVLLQTVSVPTLRVRLVPIVLTAHNNIAGKVTPANLAEYVRGVQTIYPVGAVEATIGTPFATGLSFGTPPVANNGFTFWQPLLAQLDAARMASADPSVHWVGVVMPPDEFFEILVGGAAYQVTSPQAVGPNTRTALVTSDDWAADPDYATVTTAHELGHNFGRSHAPCVMPPNPLPADVDPAYPYPGGKIGLPGFDVRSWMNRDVIAPTVILPDVGDIMGYCDTNWASDYTYRGILNFRGTAAAAGAAMARARAEPVVRSLVVTGSIASGVGGVTINPGFITETRQWQPRTSGAYRIEGRGADGRLLFSQQFSPTAIAHVPDVHHFAVTVPMTPAVEAALVSLTVTGPEGIARMDRPAGPAQLRAAGDLMPRRSPGGAVVIACRDAGARALVVRDERTGDIIASVLGSQAQVLADPGTPLSVACSDGVHSASRSVIAP